MVIDIRDDLLKLHMLGLLEPLLGDKTTGRNILWATEAYASMGEFFARDKIIQTTLITSSYSGVIKTRARKEYEQQNLRTRQKAEVFTPLWVVKKMNDHADEVWWEERLKADWKDYVDSRRLEITCGEGPYLVSRYDVETGQAIPIPERVGILDRKLRAVNENTATEEEWLRWAFRAVEATYGYEFQGDNLLIARINVLMTFADYLWDRWGREPTEKEYKSLVNVVTWNLWQMDGLTGTIPYSVQNEETMQCCMYPEAEDQSGGVRVKCRVKNHRGGGSVEYSSLPVRGKKGMKFDFIIGNPPYQEEQEGDNKTFAPPVYHKFMEGSYAIADVVELITPGRFLFNAGSTPKQWNQKMLADPHFKVVWFEQDSKRVFPNTDIKGGIAISYRDERKTFGAIEVFTKYPTLNEILKKAGIHDEKQSLMSIIYIQNRFDLSVLLSEHPECKAEIGSNGKDARLEKNIFVKIPLFTESGDDGDTKVLGIFNQKRTWRYIPTKYIDKNHENLKFYKVVIPVANGNGVFGESLSSPIIEKPYEAYTRSFVGIGAFDNEISANAALKYIKGKFCRAMLSIMKVTQMANRDVWKYVPIQDFTPASDIDWSKSIREIDQQLYAKYGLDDKEIEFIETHVKEME